MQRAVIAHTEELSQQFLEREEPRKILAGCLVSGPGRGLVVRLLHMKHALHPDVRSGTCSMEGSGIRLGECCIYRGLISRSIALCNLSRY